MLCCGICVCVERNRQHCDTVCGFVWIGVYCLAGWGRLWAVGVGECWVTTIFGAGEKGRGCGCWRVLGDDDIWGWGKG